jgi:hypothetical protein
MHFVDEARKLRRFPADHEVGMSGDRVTAREPVAVALAIGRYVTNSSRRGIFTLCFASQAYETWARSAIERWEPPQQSGKPIARWSDARQLGDAIVEAPCLAGTVHDQ